MKKHLLATSILALSAVAPNLYAHQAGDILVRAGAVTVTTGESSSSVKTTTSLGDIGGEASLNNNTQLGLNFAYMLTDKIGIELLAATPFEHKASISGTGAVDGSLGKVKHLPPTLSAVYYPMESGSAFQPYVGLGVNYTVFFDEKMSGSAKQTGALDNLKVKNSWGWAAQIGADYMLTDKILLNAQVRYIDIDTKATVDVDLGPLRISETGSAKVDLDIKPVVYMVGVGYKF